MKAFSFTATALVALALTGNMACGNAEIVFPASLRIVDTQPGNGALVPAGSAIVVLVFSEEIEVPTLASSVALAELSPGGEMLRELGIEFVSYAPDDHRAVFTTEDLPTDASFRLTVRATKVRGASGSTLETDIVRWFRTSDH